MRCSLKLLSENKCSLFNSFQLVGGWVLFLPFLPKAWNITLDSYQQSFKDLPRSLKMNDRWPPTEFVYFWQKSIISFPKMTSQHHYLNLGFDDPSLSIWLTKQDTFLKFIVPSAACSYPSPKMCSWCLRVFMQSSIRWLFWENNLGLKHRISSKYTLQNNYWHYIKEF